MTFLSRTLNEAETRSQHHLEAAFTLVAAKDERDPIRSQLAFAQRTGLPLSQEEVGEASHPSDVRRATTVRATKDETAPLGDVRSLCLSKEREQREQITGCLCI